MGPDVRDVRVPHFITVTNVTPKGGDSPEFVISNEATGRYFMANTATVQFFTALKTHRSVPAAMQAAGLDPQIAAGLVKRLMDHGLLIRAGDTQTPAAPKAPIEGKLISARWDMVDVSGLARRLSWVGRLAYSRLGAALWLLAMTVMAFQLLSHRDKAALTLRQVLEADWRQWLVMTAVFLGLKALHELGHVLAYQQMCRAEGQAPGPIRVGLAIFAFTPFPFTDVTGSWRLRQRWRRVMIGAGGIYFETWAMAGLTLIWAQTQAGLFQTVVLQVAVFAGALALVFNLNPAIKLDGYFILTDLLRQPNLATRATQAARSWTARLLGAPLPRPARGELAYWLLSYGYRWTVFAGIFWLIYQVDPRLGPLALGLVLMSLVVRPMMQTTRFLKSVGVQRGRILAVTLGVAALIGLAFVPLPDHLRVRGQFLTYETRFVEPTEAGRLVDRGGRLRLENPELTQQIRDTELHQDVLENLKRASFANAQDQASFAAEIQSSARTLDQLRARQARLTLAEDGPVWTPLEARWLRGAWVTQAHSPRLGALSEQTAPFVRLTLHETQLAQDFPMQVGDSFAARMISAPACELTATLTTDPWSAIALDGVVLLHATVGDIGPSCVDKTVHGAALLARLPMGPRSLIGRLRLGGARALQDRLQLESR